MNDLNASPSLLGGIERWLNRVLLKLFPVWYLSKAAQTLNFEPIDQLNPPSFLAHRWLSIRSVCQALSESLGKEGAEWQPLVKLLDHLVVEKEATRNFSITAIHGVEQSQYTDDWPSLIAYADHFNNDGELAIDSIESFNHNVSLAFPDEQRPHPIVYREWDGRAYWINADEPLLLGQLQQYAQAHQRDALVYSKINIEALSSAALDKIHHNWWLLVCNKNSIYEFAQLAQEAELPVRLGNFEWRRDDLAVLIAPKNNSRLNRILLNLIHRRSTKEIVEFGNYINRKHHPIPKSKKGG